MKKIITLLMSGVLFLSVVSLGLAEKGTEKKAGIYWLKGCILAYPRHGLDDDKVTDGLAPAFKKEYPKYKWTKMIVKEYGSWINYYGFLGCTSNPEHVKKKGMEYSYDVKTRDASETSPCEKMGQDAFGNKGGSIKDSTQKTVPIYKLDKNCIILYPGKNETGVTYDELCRGVVPQFAKKYEKTYPFKRMVVISLGTINDYGLMGCEKVPMSTNKVLTYTYDADKNK